VPQYQEDKVRRLLNSAEYFGFRVDAAGIAESLKEAIAGAAADCHLTIRASRDGEISTEVAPLPPWVGDVESSRTLSGMVAEQSVSTDNVFLFHNTTDGRLGDAVARQHPEGGIVILINQYDEVAGSLSGNIVAFIDGDWLTPPTDCGAVGSAYRSELVVAGRIHERVITRGQLLRADSIGVIDDICGWRRVQLPG
jgi:para-aminobenzoate synthetase/4-amino-4-deoxychorismate lyase